MTNKKEYAYKAIAVFNTLDALREILSNITTKTENSAYKLLEILSHLEDDGASVYVGHECGIGHTATDFDDTDELGVAKTKVFEYISWINGKPTLEFTDGTTSTNFAIDDILYFVRDLLDEVRANAPDIFVN